MLKVLKFVILIFVFSGLCAQQEQDSLLGLLDKTTAANEKARIYSQLGRNIASNDPEQALEFYSQALAYYKNAPDSDDKAIFYGRIGTTCATLKDYQKADLYLNKSMEVAQNIGNYETLLISGANYINDVLFEQMNFKKALKLALSTQDEIQLLDNDSLEYRANNMLLDVYFMLPDVEKQFADLAAKNLLIANNIGNDTWIEVSLFNLALAYSRNLNPQESINTYKKFIKTQLDPPMYRSLGGAYNNMAAQFRALGQLDSAIYYFEKGYEAAILGERRVSQAASKLYLGGIMLEMGKPHHGLKNCEQAMQIFVEDEIMRRRDDCAKCLYEAHKALGNKDKALKYLEMAIALEEQYMSDESKHDLEVMRKDHEFMLEHVADSIAHERDKQLKDIQIEKQRLETEKVEQEKTALILIISLSVAFGALAIVLGLFAYRKFKTSQKQNQVIIRQKLEVEQQKQVIDQAYGQLEEKNLEIIDSINYAKRIQGAILPTDNSVKNLFTNSFVFYQPKDIVAGDFYWFQKIGDIKMFAVADCTGHGVPGALVSVICHNALNRATREFKLTDPGAILDKTREIVIAELDNAEDEVKDGMDIALCTIQGTQLKFSGANNPLWVIRDNELIETKADKQPIGKFDKSTPFTTREHQLKEQDSIYIFTDGYVDQFGGERGKKFKSKALKELILGIQDLEMAEQKEKLASTITSWMGNIEQVDDMCIIGIRPLG